MFYLQSHYWVSERRACELSRVSRTTYRYQRKRTPQDALKQRIKELAQTRIRYGDKCIHVLLKREGIHVNHKRVHRLYCELGLQLKPKRPKRHVSSVHRMTPLISARSANQYWSMDFVSDQFSNRQRFRALTVIDIHTRECLAIKANVSMKGEQVVEVLTKIAANRGVPKGICCDNGSEFSGRLMDLWAYYHKVSMIFSRLGKPTDNAYIESFNGSLRDECLNCHWFENIDQANEVLEAWRIDYNENRPHRALNNCSPCEYANVRQKEAGISP